jgi:hypothetical protein
MNILQIKEDLKNQSSDMILSYLWENHLDNPNWFNLINENETLFYHLFFKDYELGSLLLNAFYPAIKHINYSELIQDENQPCFINNYLKPIINGVNLMDYLTQIQTPNHGYGKDHLNVLGHFAQGFKIICNITVNATRESLSFYNTFLKSFTEKPESFKTHELIRAEAERCYMYDNTISLFAHYIQSSNIKEFKDKDDWNRVIAFIPLVSVFCKLREMANQNFDNEKKEKHATFLYQRLEEKLKSENCLSHEKDWIIFNELKYSHYENTNGRYALNLSHDAIYTKPYQLMNDILAYSTIKQYNAEKVEALILENQLGIKKNESNSIKKIKI